MTKRVVAFLCLILIIVLVTINIKVHYTPEVRVMGSDTINHDLLKELHGLRDALHKNADTDMQKLYPEGYVFLNALYGLAWYNFMMSNSSFFNEGHAEIQKSWDKINSERARSTFDEELPLHYGAFYTGWSTYLLGKKISVEKKVNWHANEIAHFKMQCERIDSAIKKNPFPVSYNGGAWPADAVLCVAALAVHDRLFPDKYSKSIKQWLGHIKTRLDSHGLISHAVNPVNGKPTELARGSSQSLMLVFLNEIDKDFAKEQFKIYKALFLDKKLGLTGIREYPKGQYGIGDVDSGPVVFQIGSAATIVGMQTMHLFGEQKAAVEMRGEIEALGLPWQDNESKIYLFGELPMADAFIAWGHSAMSLKHVDPDFTFFHIYSAVALSIVIFAFWYLTRKTSNVQVKK